MYAVKSFFPKKFDGPSWRVLMGRPIRTVPFFLLFVKEYDEAGQILSYYTGAGSVSDGVYPGTGLTTKAVDEDVQIVYVDAEDNTAGSEIGVNAFDGVTGKANVVVVFEDNNTSKPIVAIYVDVNSDIAQ